MRPRSSRLPQPFDSSSIRARRAQRADRAERGDRFERYYIDADFRTKPHHVTGHPHLTAVVRLRLIADGIKKTEGELSGNRGRGSRARVDRRSISLLQL